MNGSRTRPTRPGGGASPRRGGPAWADERNTDRGNVRLEQAKTSLRAERVFDDASNCQACMDARAESGDDGVLCDQHLAAALGMP